MSVSLRAVVPKLLLRRLTAFCLFCGETHHYPCSSCQPSGLCFPSPPKLGSSSPIPSYSPSQPFSLHSRATMTADCLSTCWLRPLPAWVLLPMPLPAGEVRARGSSMEEATGAGEQTASSLSPLCAPQRCFLHAAAGWITLPRPLLAAQGK